MSDDSRRIEVLEDLVRRLYAEVASLRTEVREARGPSAAPRTEAPRAEPPRAEPPRAEPPRVEPPRETRPGADVFPGLAPREPAMRTEAHEPAATPHAPMPGRAPRHLDAESLVGRYGTIALAVLTIVMGLGAFLRWAVEHVQLGPEVRVGLGAAAAIGTAVLGWWLRERGARQYGNMLIGLALALVHVVAWGAGPYLHVVSDGVALAVAAACSVALAALAWREKVQALFAAGLGGALLAPFVTTSGGGRLEALLSYGLVLAVTGTLALRGEPWRLAQRLLSLGVMVYAGAALTTLRDADPALRRGMPAAFALACAVVAVLWGGDRHRRPLAYAQLGTALLALLVVARPMLPLSIALGLAVAGAVLAMAASAGEGERHNVTGEYRIDGLESGRGSAAVVTWPVEPTAPWVGVTGYPLAFLAAALFALRDPLGATGALVCAGFALLAALGAMRDWNAHGVRRGAHLVTLGVALVGAAVLALHDRPVAVAIVLGAHAVAFAALARRTDTPLALAPSLLALALGTMAAWDRLAARPAFEYVPFLTSASLAAACIVAAWVLAAREARHVVWITRGGGSSPTGPIALVVTAAIVALLWGREELRRAFSPGLATFLLIAYYAAAGVGTIGYGRARGNAAARRAGLALAVVAALKALATASDIAEVGLRVGSYLLVGAFLLGVAYWYRAEGADDDEPPARGGDPDLPPAVRAPADDALARERGRPAPTRE